MHQVGIDRYSDYIDALRSRTSEIGGMKLHALLAFLALPLVAAASELPPPGLRTLDQPDPA